MLVEKANVESPMVLHTMNPQVAESYLGLPALQRFNRVLSDTNKPKKLDADWTAAIDTYLGQLGDIAKDPDYSAAPETVSYAGVSMDGTATTLMLMGERGVSVARGLISLIGQDTTFKSMFNSVYQIGEDEMGVTGLDGMLRDIDALADDARESAILTFKLVGADAPVGIYVTLTAGDKTFLLDLAFYEDGHLRDFDISFTGFDGSSIAIQDKNVSNGGDQYTANFIYTVAGPGGALQENMTATVESTVTGSTYEARTQYAYAHEATDDMDAFSINADLTYSQTTGSGTLNTTAGGTIDLVSPDETTSFSMDLTSVQTDGAATVTPPEFLAGSGISTADQQGLYEALGDFDGASFVLAPMTTQMLAAVLLLLN
jgi:hypothetical protein